MTRILNEYKIST